ncbi:TetR/AcrR family transcriptional regulator [Spongiimicrobium salis]|uniref:TetR/AcrR family transcriptional regulator n=1 Tax=Spongiimicrobium salis TaxID=1667022 RepID=UPI00374D8B19
MQDKLEARKRILNTADELFHRQGYNETGINQIIKEANVAKASLYYHFKTKDDLCVAYLQHRNEMWNTDFYNFIKDKEEKVLGAFDFLMENNVAFDYRGCSFLNMLSETAIHKAAIFEELQNHKKSFLLFFEQEITDPELAYTIYSLFENAILESQLYRSQEPVKRLQKIARHLMEHTDSIV